MVARMVMTGVGLAVRRRARAGCSTRSPRCAACASRSATRARRPSSSRRSPIRGAAEPYPFVLSRSRRWSLNPQPAILAVLADLARRRAGVDDLGALSRRPRAGDRRGAACSRPSARELDLAVLSGGVFQNRLLLELTRGRRSRRPGCASSCPSGCRRTTVRSRSGRSRSRPRGSPQAERAVSGAAAQRRPSPSRRCCPVRDGRRDGDGQRPPRPREPALRRGRELQRQRPRRRRRRTSPCRSRSPGS